MIETKKSSSERSYIKQVHLQDRTTSPSKIRRAPLSGCDQTALMGERWLPNSSSSESNCSAGAKRHQNTVVNAGGGMLINKSKPELYGCNQRINSKRKRRHLSNKAESLDVKSSWWRGTVVKREFILMTVQFPPTIQSLRRVTSKQTHLRSSVILNNHLLLFFFRQGDDGVCQLKQHESIFLY